jgi:hypothetical protein
MRHDTPRYKTSATPAHLDPFFSGNWEVLLFMDIYHPWYHYQFPKNIGIMV